MKRKLVLLIVLIALAAGGSYWWRNYQANESHELVLYGNIDLRQVQLSFNNSDRIADVLVQEGDHVRKGQVLARLGHEPIGAAIGAGDRAGRGAAPGGDAPAQRQPARRNRSGTR